MWLSKRFLSWLAKMNNLIPICCTILTLVLTNLAMAYKEPTHEVMSEAATFASVLSMSDTLGALGLTGTINDPTLTFPNSKGTQKVIKDLFRDGARFEDNFPRSLNHFFDPINDKGLGGTNIKSPDWALEDKDDLGAQQEFSYKDARQYFYDALTQTDITKRDESFGKTFQTLGQIIHHVQDMAQPQHVRNDDHCDIWPCRLVPGLYSPSLYEKYSDLQRENGMLSYSGYEPGVFATPRQFWTGGDGRGMADFSNANFVSAGTNFLLLGGAAVPGRYVEPTPLAETAEPIEPLFASKGATVPPECLAPNPPCTMSFFSSLVWDKYLNKSEINTRASTLSIFDQDLNVYGKQVSYTDPDTGVSYTSDRLFALNSFNFDAAHGFLIPRAVAYSAGLINYFFRGKLDVAQDSEYTGKLAVFNLGQEAMAGTFSIYYDDENDVRHLISSTVLSADAGTATAGMGLSPITGSMAKPKTIGEYMLVFNGDMGAEKASADSKGAVTGKLFADPFQMQLKTLLFDRGTAGGYGLFGQIYRNSELGNLIAYTQETFSLIVSGKHYPCAVYGSVLVYCYSQVYPYEEFYFDPTGGWSGSPELEWNWSTSYSGTITLMLGDVVVFSFKYAAEQPQTYSTVNFEEQFRWDTSEVKQITSGNITW